MAHLFRLFAAPARITSDTRLPVYSDTSPLKCEHGVVRAANGPGFGVTIDPDFLRDCNLFKQELRT